MQHNWPDLPERGARLVKIWETLRKAMYAFLQPKLIFAEALQKLIIFLQMTMFLFHVFGSRVQPEHELQEPNYCSRRGVVLVL